MKITDKKIILASSSSRRIDILKKLGLDFVIEKADVNEATMKNEKAKDFVQRLAKKKRKKLLKNIKIKIVLSSVLIPRLNLKEKFLVNQRIKMRFFQRFKN